MTMQKLQSRSATFRSKLHFLQTFSPAAQRPTRFFLNLLLKSIDYLHYLALIKHGTTLAYYLQILNCVTLQLCPAENLGQCRLNKVIKNKTWFQPSD